AVILIAAAAFFGWRFFASAPPPQNERTAARGTRGVPVEVAEIARETIREIAQFTGTLMPSARFVISPKIQGRLEEILVNIGDSVENGALIAVLDGEEYLLAVAQAQAELEVSRANRKDSESAMETARRELDRVKELRSQKIASEAELDAAEAKYNTAQAAYEVSRAQIQQREAALEAARVRLSYTRIHAGWKNGDEKRIVSERFIDAGNMLRANDPIVAIVDIDPVVAQINVIERDFPEIRIGQRAIVSTDAYPDRTFDGLVVRRSPVLTEESRQAMVEIEIPNYDSLLAPGMYVRTRIEFERKRNAIVIPASSLVRREGKRGIFIADKDTQTASFVPVQTGIVEEERMEVTSPDIQGLVVTLGQHLLEDGAAVRITEQTTGPEN
ncbi:MAG: efflux RND transporter periplasmic adaptor subunit, partial [Thermodesulfobacteriota bacterium]